MHNLRVRCLRHALAFLPLFAALAAPIANAQSGRAALIARLDSLAATPVREGRAVGISVAVGDMVAWLTALHGGKEVGARRLIARAPGRSYR